MQYPTEYLHLKDDAQQIVNYLRKLNSLGSDEAETAAELTFRIGLRMIRMENEMASVGKFIATAPPLDT